jgi:hypothetical protein
MRLNTTATGSKSGAKATRCCCSRTAATTGAAAPRFDRQKSSSVFLPSRIETGVVGAGSVTEPITSGSSSAG